MAAPRTPILLQTCSRAASADELRFRIDRPVDSTRSARIVAVDAAARAVTRRLVTQGWDPARFLEFHDGGVLRSTDGDDTDLGRELGDADAVVMVAVDGAAAGGAEVVGGAALEAGVMTAGVVVGRGAGSDEGDVDAAVAALRPYAMVLLVMEDERDLEELLTALRV